MARTSYVLSGSQGELVSQKRSGVSVPDYFLRDGQGSVRALTDNTGALVSGQNYSYSAFGKLLSGQTASSTATNYLYTGQQFDSATGLYDLRARYYNPATGQFQSQDKFEISLNNPVELNRYTYTANNPVYNYDPSGTTLGEIAAFLYINGTKYTSAVVGIASSISYPLIRAIQMIAASRYAIQAKEIFWEVQDKLEETFEKNPVIINAGEKAQFTMSKVTIAYSTYKDEVTGIVRRVISVNASASDEVKQVMRDLYGAEVVTGGEHAEINVLDAVVSWSNNDRWEAFFRTYGVIGISNGTGPCGPERQDCQAIINAAGNFAVSFLEQYWR